MKRIMVTGATGQLGGQVLNFLMQKAGAVSISAIARDPSKIAGFQQQGVSVFQADYDDLASLIKAFANIDVLYFVSASEIPKRMKQHENVLTAVRETGVKHVVYTSLQRKDETKESPVAAVSEVHLYTEKWLKESGITYTILKHTLYSEVIPMFIGGQVFDSGQIYLPAGDGKAAFATCTDMAEASANILTTSGHNNKVYEIASGQTYSYHDVAKILGEISGKEIRYVSPTVGEFQKTLKSYGAPEVIVMIVTIFSQAIALGEYDQPDQTLAGLLGREPETLASFLKRRYSKFQ
ncbi:SDR family oxidoreductase [Gaoshiqia sp. Z1-71]|uniref:SDR family oxidoreductase n=1 Tax=Gaoshiqia hydrogeniformans TaxID=3290090 RepID=UPI003BF89286